MTYDTAMDWFDLGVAVAFISIGITILGFLVLYLLGDVKSEDVTDKLQVRKRMEIDE